jgi:hypothetical protein
MVGTGDKSGRTRDLLRATHRPSDGHRPGTGTFEFEAASGVYSELQWLLHLHGRRIRPQPRARRRPDLGLRAEPLRVGDEYRALRTMIRSRSRVWFVQLAPGHRLDVDIGFVLASLREVVGHLQAQPGFRAAAECLVKAVRHIR